MLRDIYWLKDKKPLELVKLTVVLLIPVFLYSVPLEWLKNQHSICLFKNLIGYECFGCGMSRAILSAIHFKFANAFHYNKLFVLVLPLLVHIWAKKLVNLWLEKPAPLNQL
jgi:hypothetical protein